MNHQLNWIDLGHQKLAYRDSFDRCTGGDESRPAIVLIHGNSCSSYSYRNQLEGELGQKYRLLAFDLPGHGESDSMSVFEDYSMAGYARVLNAALRQLVSRNPGLRFVLVGWSLGGHIALEMSLDCPALKGVMIFGTPPLGFPPDMENAFLPADEVGIGMKGEVTEEEARIYARSFFSPSYFGDSLLNSSEDNGRVLDEYATLIMNTDPNARLGLGQNLGPDTYHDEVEIVGNLPVPLAVFHGEDEKLVNLDYIRGLSMPALWRGEVQVIKGAGHAPQIESTAVFDSLLGEFVEGVS